MLAHYRMMARYNQWANRRLYSMAALLPDGEYRRHVGAYFGSLHRTLNHLMATDLMWAYRLASVGAAPLSLDAVVFDDFASLELARRVEDARLVDFVTGLRDGELQRHRIYGALDGKSYRQPLGELLTCLFNHQTHHRGQAHTILTLLGIREPQPLDLLIMIRETGTTVPVARPA